METRALTLRLPTPAALTRFVLLAFAFLLPLLYDSSVPEVSGDIRWTFTHLAAIVVTLLGLWAWAEQRTLKVPLHQPRILWWALGLAIWAAVSMVDSINPDRGIVLIKAMYAQLILLTAAYMVATPRFIHRLAWVLAIPVPFFAWVGTCQFFNWTDASFTTLLLNTPGMGWLGAIWPGNLIDPFINFYLQSAVPGSTFANKNLAGSYTVFMLPIVAYTLVAARTWYAKSYASMALATGTLFLVYSRSRASWVALVVGLVFFACVLAFHKPWRQAILQHMSLKALAAWLLPTVILVGAFGHAVSPITTAHAVNRTPGQQVEALATASWDEVGGRLAYNLNSFAIIKDHWFNGTGLGTFFSIYPAYHNAIVETPLNSYSVMARPQRTHTDLMQAFDEMGLFGGTCYTALLLSALGMAWRLGRKQAMTVLGPQLGIFPLFAGMGLLVISINALMDFPMQLPTAPAAAALLMGTLTALHRKAYPKSGWRPRWFTREAALRLKRPVIVAAIAVWAVTSTWAMYDNIKFRQANQMLKAGMIRIFSGVTDDETLRIVKLAQETYKRDPRIYEHLAVVYANYRGTQPMPIEERIAMLEWMLERDPWGPNHLINLAGQHLQLAEQMAIQGNQQAANRSLERVDDIFGRLQRVAGFSHYTWGIGGMLRMLQGRDAEALSYLERATGIEPNYPPAQHALGILQQRQGLQQPAPTSPTAP